ncbi:hypothetical protein V8F20_010126 [Naviculisporaceae sp. PSN 640]
MPKAAPTAKTPDEKIAKTKGKDEQENAIPRQGTPMVRPCLVPQARPSAYFPFSSPEGRHNRCVGTTNGSLVAELKTAPSEILKTFSWNRQHLLSLWPIDEDKAVLKVGISSLGILRRGRRRNELNMPSRFISYGLKHLWRSIGSVAGISCGQVAGFGASCSRYGLLPPERGLRLCAVMATAAENKVNKKELTNLASRWFTCKRSDTRVLVKSYTLYHTALSMNLNEYETLDESFVPGGGARPQPVQYTSTPMKEKVAPTMQTRAFEAITTTTTTMTTLQPTRYITRMVMKIPPQKMPTQVHFTVVSQSIFSEWEVAPGGQGVGLVLRQDGCAPPFAWFRCESFFRASQISRLAPPIQDYMTDVVLLPLTFLESERLSFADEDFGDLVGKGFCAAATSGLVMTLGKRNRICCCVKLDLVKKCKGNEVPGMLLHLPLRPIRLSSVPVMTCLDMLAGRVGLDSLAAR